MKDHLACLTEPVSSPLSPPLFFLPTLGNKEDTLGQCAGLEITILSLVVVHVRTSCEYSFGLNKRRSTFPRTSTSLFGSWTVIVPREQTIKEAESRGRVD